MMKVYIKLLSGEIQEIELHPPYTIPSFQQTIRQQLGIKNHVTVFPPLEDSFESEKVFHPQYTLPYPILIQPWFDFCLEPILPPLPYDTTHPYPYPDPVLATMLEDASLLCHTYQLTVNTPSDRPLAVYSFVIFSINNTFYDVTFEYVAALFETRQSVPRLYIAPDSRPHTLLRDMDSESYYCIRQAPPYLSALQDFLQNHFQPLQSLPLPSTPRLYRTYHYPTFQGHPSKDTLLAFPSLLLYVYQDLLGG